MPTVSVILESQEERHGVTASPNVWSNIALASSAKAKSAFFTCGSLWVDSESGEEDVRPKISAAVDAQPATAHPIPTVDPSTAAISVSEKGSMFHRKASHCAEEGVAAVRDILGAAAPKLLPSRLKPAPS